MFWDLVFRADQPLSHGVFREKPPELLKTLIFLSSVFFNKSVFVILPVMLATYNMTSKSQFEHGIRALDYLGVR